ncbi:hypothetical protein TanjilG_29718 [Lupinus angustifolius]|uniref:non-specific serine/threonine protein kinase n=1 Tax=Lupinus angustifolius TaxID=3871 RepID=A0A4P1R5Z9_LUPAN|nr:hypothetical protein TanjilG_29718 [Lupinus angustifolius]
MGNTCRGSFKGKYTQAFSHPQDNNNNNSSSNTNTNTTHSSSSSSDPDNNNNLNNNNLNLHIKQPNTIMRRGPDNQAYYVLGHKTPNIRDLYTLGRKLGQGQFGTTYLCTHNSTSLQYACKSISKRKLISKEDVEDVRREIQIMHHLAGHNNIVTIKGAYEDPLYVHIVMELCSGGELFDRIIQRGHYTERKAAQLTKIIVGVVEACHSLGVMHRDLKPENFLLVNKDHDFSLKAIDFGLSVFFKPGQVFTDVVGSPYYVAPEVLLKHYGPEADVWTAGVILYILLSGVPPFWAETQQGIFDAVLKGHIDFDSDPWPLISDSGKDLIRKMLCSRPSERLTAHERKLISKEDVEDVRREIQIMHHLAGHNNIVTIKGAYEDPLYVHIVMELCSGGELFDRIIQRGHYTERKAAQLTKIIVGVVEACHSLGVMHRDLKPENFLLVNKDHDFSLKAIDFGLSVFFKPGQVFTDVVGSPYYVAPEVLLKHYGPEADVWTAGVILYILLSGVPPFWAETQQGIFDAVLKGHIDFDSDPWPLISDSGKDLIRKMLCSRPSERLTAHEVLSPANTTIVNLFTAVPLKDHCGYSTPNRVHGLGYGGDREGEGHQRGHPWICENGVAPDRALDPAVLSRLKHFSAMNKLKKMALRVIAESLSEEEIAGLREMFQAMDTDNSGAITFDELKAGLRRYGSTLKDTEIQDLMEAADVDNSGTIDYGEFIAATVHLNKLEREEHLIAAFHYFDKDGSGYITVDELQQACAEHNMTDVFLEDIIREVDQDNDGRIDYGEFAAMMQKGNPGVGRRTMRNSLNLSMRDAPSPH